MEKEGPFPTGELMKDDGYAVVLTDPWYLAQESMTRADSGALDNHW
jgi:hypothetical protein